MHENEPVTESLWRKNEELRTATPLATSSEYDPEAANFSNELDLMNEIERLFTSLSQCADDMTDAASENEVKANLPVQAGNTGEPYGVSKDCSKFERETRERGPLW